LQAIAIIPARIGSRRIKEKNITTICGKPMITWVIENAIQSQVFEKIYVSTDSPKIADIAKNSGAEVPFLRDTELSNDFTGTTDVIKNVIARINLNENIHVCCIYPTAVLINPQMFRRSFEFAQKNLDTLTISVGKFSHPIERAMRAMGNDSYVNIFPEYQKSRSQAFSPTYFDAGQFYWGKVSTWNKEQQHLSTKGIVLKQYQFVDIDLEEDLTLAERLLKFNILNQVNDNSL
jgi:N-acylneuraminate cytidylyltransferase